MKISFVVAVAENGVMGKKGDLPWHIPEDLKLFKQETMGKIMVMGRTTWESLKKKTLTWAGERGVKSAKKLPGTRGKGIP